MELIYAMIAATVIYFGLGVEPQHADKENTWHEIRDPKRDLETHNKRLYIRSGYEQGIDR